MILISLKSVISRILLTWPKSRRRSFICSGRHRPDVATTTEAWPEQGVTSVFVLLRMGLA